MNDLDQRKANGYSIVALFLSVALWFVVTLVFIVLVADTHGVAK